MNFGHRDLSLVSRLCVAADTPYREQCFERIGSYLTNLISTEEEKTQACASVPKEYRHMCLGHTANGEPEEDDPVPADMRQGQTVFTDTKHAPSLRDTVGTALSSLMRFVVDTIASLQILFARPVSAQGTDNALLAEVQRCATLEQGSVTCYASLCDHESGFMCAKKMLEAATVGSGPELAMQMLEAMMTGTVFPSDNTRVRILQFKNKQPCCRHPDTRRYKALI